MCIGSGEIRPMKMDDELKGDRLTAILELSNLPCKFS